MSEPIVKPFAAVAATLLNVAVPPETEAVPRVVLPIVNVTAPVIDPAVDELTDAISVVALPIVTELGVADTVMPVGTAEPRHGQRTAAG